MWHRIFTACLTFALVIEVSGFASAQSENIDSLSKAILREKCDGISVNVSRLAAKEKNEMLAVLYDRGCGVAQDMPHALRLYHAAILAGGADLRSTGYVDIFSGDAEHGVALLTQAAQNGDPFAPNVLANYYASLSDVSRTSDVPMRKWDEAASKLGDIAGSAHLADDLYNGYGGPADVVRARHLLEAALQANDPSALLLRARQLSHGIRGEEKDEALGLQYLRKALASKSAGVDLYVALVADGQVAAHQMTVSEAISLGRDGARRLLPQTNAQVNLGMVLLHYNDENGNPLPNCAEAVPLLRQGTNFLSPYPDMLLTMCYLYPLGISTDRAKAEYYAKAGQRKGWVDAIAYLQSADNYYASTDDANQTATMQRIRSITRQQLMRPSTPGLTPGY